MKRFTLLSMAGAVLSPEKDTTRGCRTGDECPIAFHANVPVRLVPEKIR